MAALQPNAGTTGVPGGHASQFSPSGAPACTPHGRAAANEGPPEGAVLEDWQRFAGMAVQRDGSIAYGAEEVEEAHAQKLIMVLFIGAAALSPGSPLPQIAMEASKLGAHCHVIMADDALHSEVVRWGGVSAIMKAPLQCIRTFDQLAAVSKESSNEREQQPAPQAKGDSYPAKPRPPSKSVPGEVKALMARFDAQLEHVMGQVAELQQVMSASQASAAAAPMPAATLAPASGSAPASAPDQTPVDIDSLTQALAEALAPPPPPEQPAAASAVPVAPSLQALAAYTGAGAGSHIANVTKHVAEAGCVVTCEREEVALAVAQYPLPAVNGVPVAIHLHAEDRRALVISWGGASSLCTEQDVSIQLDLHIRALLGGLVQQQQAAVAATAFAAALAPPPPPSPLLALTPGALPPPPPGPPPLSGLTQGLPTGLPIGLPAVLSAGVPPLLGVYPHA